MRNRGITLVELIISVSLISIVVLFLFSLLVDVRYSDNKVDYSRDNQQKRAIIIKRVQDDFLDYGLIGLNDTGSTTTKLIINFTFGSSKTGILTITSDSVTYKDANGETEKWPLEKETESMKYNVRCVQYTKTGFDLEGEFFSIWFKIPLDVKANSKNAVDDLEFSYIGKKSGVSNTSFVNGLYLGEYNTSTC